MTWKARVEFDPRTLQIRAALGNTSRDNGTAVMLWPDQNKVSLVPPGIDLPDDLEGMSLWLRFDDDQARALYEGLANYFGGAGNDSRALRADYDAERARVDLLLRALLQQPSSDALASTVRATVDESFSQLVRVLQQRGAA